MCSFGGARTPEGKQRQESGNVPEQEDGLSFGCAQGHPSTSIPWTDETTNHGGSNTIPTASAVGIPSPSPDPFHLPVLHPNISGRKQSWAPPCWQAVFRAQRQQECHSRKEIQPQTDPGMLLLTCHRGNPNSSACGTPPASHDRAWARGSSGELPSHASAWHCKKTPVSPLGKGEKWVWSCKSAPFNPSLHRDLRMCCSRTARIFLLFLKSRGEEKKKSHFSARDSPALTTEQPNCCSSLG